MNRALFRFAALVALAAAPACARAPEALPPRSAAPAPAEHPVRLLPLAGPAADARLEISAMAWRGDHLVLVPETLGLASADGRVVPGPQVVYVLDRADVLAVVDGRDPGPLTPRAVPVTPSIADLPYLDGFEAIAFDGDTAYLTIETSPRPDGAHPGLVVRGHLAPDLSALELELDAAVGVECPTLDPNSNYEALFIWGGAVHAIYELNGAFFNAAPVVRRLGLDLAPLADLPFAHLDYRVTDVTAPDRHGRLWAVNFRFPGSAREARAPAARDALAVRHGVGASHARFEQVERLVELVIGPAGLRVSDRPPLQLELPASWRDGGARNWEGIARLDDRGLLLVTDLHPRPRTLLGFVALPTAPR